MSPFRGPRRARRYHPLPGSHPGPFSSCGLHEVRQAVGGIIPPHMLRELAQRGTPMQRARALNTLIHTEQLRGQRDILSLLTTTTPAGQKQRTIYDAQHASQLPGRLVRAEGAPKVADRAVNEAYDYAGVVYDFCRVVLGRNSIDDRGLRLDASVHYGVAYDNAFWNGTQMVYGDGDGEIFQRFTKSLEVIGHELTHGITQYEAALDYRGQSGALNESFSDVVGVLVKQWKLGQTAAEADWIIGADLLAKGVHGVGIRSLKSPGSAYDDPRLGKDPQPAHMKQYCSDVADNGGVHLNSGIPNHAFYLAAVSLGGHAWEAAGTIWYNALCHRLRPQSRFAEAAHATSSVAGELFGVRSREQRAVQTAWQMVGVIK